MGEWVWLYLVFVAGSSFYLGAVMAQGILDSVAAVKYFPQPSSRSRGLKWPLRVVVLAVYAWALWDYVADSNGRSLVQHLAATLLLVVFFALGFQWWRMDALEEFERLTRKAIGSDANILILTARLNVTTRSIVKLNYVMRRYDIMNVSPLDLPPEAKELRNALEWAREL